MTNVEEARRGYRDRKSSVFVCQKVRLSIELYESILIMLTKVGNFIIRHHSYSQVKSSRQHFLPHSKTRSSQKILAIRQWVLIKKLITKGHLTRNGIAHGRRLGGGDECPNQGQDQ